MTDAFYDTNVRDHYTTISHGAYVRLNDQTRFPAVSTINLQYPESSSMPVLTTVTAIAKYAHLNYIVNTSEMPGGSATSGALVKFADGSHVDAFSRLRTSQPFTLFDSKLIYNKSQLFWSQALSAGSITFNSNDSSLTLSTSGVGYAIRQTAQRFGYQPGKSQIAMFTGILSADFNSIKRYGLFSSLTAAPYDVIAGMYFEASRGVLACVINNSSNLVPSQSATQTNWNIDKLDGTGSSGITLDLTKVQIFTIDYEWLGSGRVRFGFDIGGKIVYCHQFNNSNANIGTYLQIPNLPVRAEIRQLSGSNAAMKVICSTVMSEGGSDFTGITRGVDSGLSGLAISTNARVAVVGVRVQATRLDSVNQLLNVGAISAPGNNANAAFKYEVIVNPTVLASGSQSWTDLTNSNLQYWNGDGTQTVSGGTVIATGFGSVGSAVDLTGGRFEKFLRLGCSVTGTRDEIYLVITPLQTNNGIYGSMIVVETD